MPYRSVHLCDAHEQADPDRCPLCEIAELRREEQFEKWYARRCPSGSGWDKDSARLGWDARGRDAKEADDGE